MTCHGSRENISSVEPDEKQNVLESFAVSLEKRPREREMQLHSEPGKRLWERLNDRLR